jgi:hypothetical protein
MIVTSTCSIGDFRRIGGPKKRERERYIYTYIYIYTPIYKLDGLMIRKKVYLKLGDAPKRQLNRQNDGPSVFGSPHFEPLSSIGSLVMLLFLLIMIQLLVG